jgi:hypothetical protein
MLLVTQTIMLHLSLYKIHKNLSNENMNLFPIYLINIF